MSTPLYLPPSVAALWANPPSQGLPIHGWIHRAARLLHQQQVPPDQIETLLEEAADKAGRFVSTGEIAYAVLRSAPNPLKTAKTDPAWLLYKRSDVSTKNIKERMTPPKKLADSQKAEPGISRTMMMHQTGAEDATHAQRAY